MAEAVAKTEFRRAWAERKTEGGGDSDVAEPVAGQTRIQSRRSPRILAHCKGRGVRLESSRTDLQVVHCCRPVQVGRLCQDVQVRVR